jgi:hypothetical protein
MGADYEASMGADYEASMGADYEASWGLTMKHQWGLTMKHQWGLTMKHQWGLTMKHQWGLTMKHQWGQAVLAGVCGLAGVEVVVKQRWGDGVFPADLKRWDWGGWRRPVGCVQLFAVAHQGGAWVQAPRFFWSRRWAPPDIGCVRRPSLVRLCLRPLAVEFTRLRCVWPAGGG